MIFVKGYGQMCNNIMQYAHLYAFGREYGVAVLSMRFSYKYRYFALCGKWYHNFLTYLIGKVLISTHIIDCITADRTPDIDRRLRDTPLIGCGAWGCRYPALFQKYKDEILRLFEINPRIRKKVNACMDYFPKTDIRLGLHIRRGDYAKWQGGKYFFADDVYHRLIQQFVAMNAGKSVGVFICTNDMQLDLNGFRKVHPQTYLLRGSGIEDLQTLASCDFIIGVKSTFSLWAAFYRDLPLYWIMDKDAPLTADSFVHFDDVYTKI